MDFKISIAILMLAVGCKPQSKSIETPNQGGGYNSGNNYSGNDYNGGNYDSNNYPNQYDPNNSANSTNQFSPLNQIPSIANNFNNNNAAPLTNQPNTGLFGGLLSNFFGGIFGGGNNSSPTPPPSNNNTTPTPPPTNNNSTGGGNSSNPSSMFTSPNCSFSIDIQAVQNAIVDLTNQNRRNNGRQNLSNDSSLEKLAYEWSTQMSSMGSNIRHRPKLGNVAENIAMFGGYNLRSPQQIAQQFLQQWMDSPGHRANILNSSYSRMGAGVYCRGSSVYATQNFK